MSGLRVEVVLALPRRHVTTTLAMHEGATVGDAALASGLPLDGIVGYAVFGERAMPTTPLRDGDRVELLRPLQADPKETRRRRAAAQRKPG
jgi:putative ubiquitin-RnfH superfamily antitoxin RatB of RatAB toxin-antitoxin module